MNIVRLREIANKIWDDYVSQARITDRWLQDYRKEVQTYKEYFGREVFELLQNADDAGSQYVKISLDREHHLLSVSNSGPRTVSFDEQGMKSIMLSDLSPKKGRPLIGAKGLGFRSVLNWAHEIVIYSGNIEICFSQTIAEERWAELRGKVNEPEAREREAQKDGRRVPLAILALPKISERPDGRDDETVIMLRYEPQFEKRIVADLQNFNPESLLFLHNVTNIEVVDGGYFRCYGKNVLQDVGTDGITVIELNGHKWVQSLQKGIDLADREYEVSCAFCMDDPRPSYCLYSFFPTKVNFPFPCVFHSTLELDSSRNALLPGSEDNMRMMDMLARRAKVIADYLKSVRHDWFPLRIMYPDVAREKNEYVQRLAEQIKRLASDGEYVPVLDGGYADFDGYYYYSDELYEELNDNDGKKVFSKMRFPKAPLYLPLDRQDSDAKAHIEQWAKIVAHNSERLANFIHLLLDCRNKPGHCALLSDDKCEIIIGKAYVNTGFVVKNIPSFKQIRYVNPELVERLKGLLDLSGDEPNRELVRRLDGLADVSSSDVSYVTRDLLPKSQDEGLSLKQKQELLQCLYMLFCERGGKLYIEDSEEKQRVRLLSQSGEWLPASGMVMTDERFPDGFDKLHTSYTYPKRKSVEYPFYLKDKDGVPADPYAVQEFMTQLGVNLYFVREKIHFVEDFEYIEELKKQKWINDEVRSNCQKSRVKGENTAEVASSEFFQNFNSISDLLLVVDKSGYVAQVCDGQKIAWFKNTWKTPVRVPLSYAAWRLRKIPLLRCLRYYSVEEGDWLPGFAPPDSGSLPRNLDAKLLSALGAKNNIEEFTVSELYDAIDNIFKIWRTKESYNGISALYHMLKRALDKRLGRLPEGRTLMMLCCIGDSFEFRDSRQLFYADNNYLPEAVLRQLPMLVLGRREGESQVKKIFGCSSLREVSVLVRSCQTNEILTRSLYSYLERRKPVLLAFASQGVGSRSTDAGQPYNEAVKNALKKFRIEAVMNIDYNYAVHENVLDTNGSLINEGELLCDSDCYYICSNADTLEKAMECPAFADSVAEALCIHLKLSGSEIENKFHRIVTSTVAQLEHYRKREIEDFLWDACSNQFGMSQKDLAFWRKVFNENNIDGFDVETLCNRRVEYLAEYLGIECARVESPRRFEEYHLQKLRECRSRYRCGYLHFRYQQIVNTPARHREYVPWMVEFDSDEWLIRLLEEQKYRLYPEYEEMVLNEMEKRWGYGANYCDSVPEHKEHEHYLRGLEKFSLSDEARSLLYFDGHDEDFEKLRCIECKDSIADDTFDSSLSISEVSIAKRGKVHSHKLDDQGRQGGAKVSQRRKEQLGKDAEKKVLASLTSSDEYEVGDVYSSNLGGTNDARGYDLEYRKRGETFWRHLEVKHYSGNAVILSANEYKVAMNDPEMYDMALVGSEDIKLVRRPFADDVKKYDIQADKYKMDFVIE